LLKIVTAIKARRNLGEILEEVFYKNNSFVIKRGEKPMAVIVPLTEYEAYRRQRDEDFRVFDEIREQSEQYGAAEVERDVKSAVQAVRKS
jgi:prevent-host-death family protein